MRAVVLGASGLIGRAVAGAFARAEHEVTALVRDRSRAPACAAEVIEGDIAAPEAWIHALQNADALIHCACDWQGDMAASDARLLDAVLASGFSGRIAYTDGVWSFGPGAVGSTDPADDPVPQDGFEWVAAGWARLRSAADAVLVHPPLVWSDAERLPGPPLTPGTQHWPLAHADDLADGYLRAVEHGTRGAAYLFVTESLRVADLAIAMGVPLEEGAPNDAYAWDQNLAPSAPLGWQPRRFWRAAEPLEAS